MSKTHSLKTWPRHFGAVMAGVKAFEIRKNDRGFEVGDVLRLEEWDPETQQYTGAVLLKYARYILYGGEFGVAPGYVVMGIGDQP